MRVKLHLRPILPLIFLLSAGLPAFAQGGPPFYTNDPGTPGHLNWEINVGYMPFLYGDHSVSHVPDLDINFGVGERIQLTYENAWLRVRDSSSSASSAASSAANSAAKFGLGQSNPGVKWRFLDGGENGLSISMFPQFFLNNPNDAVRRGITPTSQSFLMPFELTKKLGPVDVDYELGYQVVHGGPNGWITGFVVGHDFTPKLEGDFEFYSQGTFHPAAGQPTFDFGGRYKIKESLIVLLMAGRGFAPTSSTQPSFIGYFGMQFLFSSKKHKSEELSTPGAR